MRKRVLRVDWRPSARLIGLGPTKCRAALREQHIPRRPFLDRWRGLVAIGAGPICHESHHVVVVGASFASHRRAAEESTSNDRCARISPSRRMPTVSTRAPLELPESVMAGSHTPFGVPCFPGNELPRNALVDFIRLSLECVWGWSSSGPAITYIQARCPHEKRIENSWPDLDGPPRLQSPSGS